MGLSLTSALIGFGLVILGATLLLIRRQKKPAIALMIVGIALVVVPYGTIYLFFD